MTAAVTLFYATLAAAFVVGALLHVVNGGLTPDMLLVLAACALGSFAGSAWWENR